MKDRVIPLGENRAVVEHVVVQLHVEGLERTANVSDGLTGGGNSEITSRAPRGNRLFDCLGYVLIDVDSAIHIQSRNLHGKYLNRPSTAESTMT